MVDYASMTKDALITELNNRDDEITLLNNKIVQMTATPETKTTVREKIDSLTERKNEILRRKVEVARIRLPDIEKNFIVSGYNRKVQEIDDKINKLSKIL